MYEISNQSLMLANVIIALSYYLLTFQLILFARNFQLLSLYRSLSKIRSQKKKMLFRVLIALGALFAAFIWLCGNTHAFRILRMIYPNMYEIELAAEIMLWLCAGVSLVTALIGLKLFPVALEILSKFELNSEGNLENAQNYLLEVVEMVKESIMIINDDMIVERCNEASKLMFSQDVVGKSLNMYIHPQDQEMFRQAVLRVLGSYNFAPLVVEYRIKLSDENNALTTTVQSPQPSAKIPTSADIRVHCSNFDTDAMPDFGVDTVNMALNALANRMNMEKETEYVWIESTLCKGMRLTQSEELEYDLKIASRNIQDRKRRVAKQEATDMV